LGSSRKKNKKVKRYEGDGSRKGGRKFLETKEDSLQEGKKRATEKLTKGGKQPELPRSKGNQIRNRIKQCYLQAAGGKEGGLENRQIPYPEELEKGRNFSTPLWGKKKKNKWGYLSEEKGENRSQKKINAKGGAGKMGS